MRRAIALGLCLAALAAAADEPAALTEEDIVRLVVGGASEAAILEQIRTRPVRFTLDPEMLAELESAGVSETIRRAMAERAADLAPPAPPPAAEPTPPEAQAPALVPLRVRLGEPDQAPVPLRLSGRVDFALRAALDLEAAVEGQPFEDVALFLACVSPAHVPDHWRAASPLGRDFVSMARHEMLAFVSGAEPTAETTAEPTPLLELELPETLEVAVEPASVHDLWIGIAVRIDGRYFHLAHDVWEDLAVDGGRDLRAVPRSSRRGAADRLAVSFERAP